MSDALQPPPPSVEALTNDQPGEPTPTDAMPQPDTADLGPARVPILSNAPVAEQQPSPTEQRLPAPAPQHNYPQPYPQPYPPQRPQQVALAEQSVAIAEPAPIARVDPYNDPYGPPPPKPQSRVWRATKWPIRQAIKGIYLLFSAAGRHRLATALILGALLLFIGAGFLTYRYTHPDTIDAHISTQANLPPLPSGVKHFIEGYHTYNGQETWDSLSAQYQAQLAQQGGSAEVIQSSLAQAKAQGISFENFVYAGGYVGSDGIGHYMIEATLTADSQKEVHNWYFVTDPNGKISAWANLTPSSGNASGQ
jgi:hypothetical protein